MGLGITISVNGTADAELAEADKVEVSERMGETTFFIISYPEDIQDGDLPRLIDSRLDPGSVLSIFAGEGNNTQCLVKGPVFSQRIHLEHGGEGSSLEVRGGDNTIKMDRSIQSVIWSDVTDSDAVTSILGNYSLTADVYSTNAKHLEDKHTLVQRESDLRFIRRLARRNGCYFWITCDSNGQETGHFLRPALDGDPASTLTINFDDPAIQELDIHWDVERPTSVEGIQLDLSTKDDLDGAVAKTPQTILGAKALQDIAPDTRSMHVAAPADDGGDMQARSEGALIEADWFIKATCTTTHRLLGQIVHANTVVAINGAGSRHSGKYLVSAVRHTIDAADHVMDIELVRNGWGTPSATNPSPIP